MNYQKIYDQFVEKRKNSPLLEPTYYEKHHIVPRSKGGNNKKPNLVRLTFREHLFAHHLLARIYNDQSTWLSLWALCNRRTIPHTGILIVNPTTRRLYKYTRKKAKNFLSAIGKKARKKRSLAKWRKKVAKPICQYSKSGEFIVEYWGAAEAARHFKKSHVLIVNCANRKRPSAYGYIWRYKDDKERETEMNFIYIMTIIEQYNKAHQKQMANDQQILSLLCQ